MDELKRQIQRKLVANVLTDKCARCEHVVFRDAWCTQERVIRFTTPFFRNLFSVEESGRGRWKTGDSVMVEVLNDTDRLTVNCVLSPVSSGYAERDAAAALKKAAGVRGDTAGHDVILKTWELSSRNGDVNGLFDSFDRLLADDLPRFERELREKLNPGNTEPKVFEEGTASCVTLNRYERSPKARAACLEVHGTACAVCGIDFGKAYGPEFAGKIEVHHVVPMSEIGEEYTVDPVKDLVPVCPNCHMALHSKKGGVYTVEELKAMRAKQ